MAPERSDPLYSRPRTHDSRHPTVLWAGKNGGCLDGAAEGFTRPKGCRELGLISTAGNGFRELIAAFIEPLRGHRDTIDEKVRFTTGKKGIQAGVARATWSDNSSPLTLPLIGSYKCLNQTVNAFQRLQTARSTPL